MGKKKKKKLLHDSFDLSHERYTYTKVHTCASTSMEPHKTRKGKQISDNKEKQKFDLYF